MNVTMAFYRHGPRDTGGALIVNGYACAARFIPHTGRASLPDRNYSGDLISRS